MYQQHRLQISHREMQVIELLAQASSTEEVADTLRLSAHTVRTHVRNIYNKLGLRNRVELVRWYLNQDTMHG